MASRPAVAHKHYRLDPQKIQRARKLLGAASETETIERALEYLIQERRRDRIAALAHRRFLASGAAIGDVFHSLGK